MLKNENINLKETCTKAYAELVLFGSLKRASGICESENEEEARNLLYSTEYCL